MNIILSTSLVEGARGEKEGKWRVTRATADGNTSPPPERNVLSNRNYKDT